MSNSKKKKMPKGSMETFFKVLRMIGNYRFLLILSIVLAAVTVVLQLYVPILFGNAIDEVVGAHAVDFDRMWYYLSRILVMVIVSSVIGQFAVSFASSGINVAVFPALIAQVCQIGAITPAASGFAAMLLALPAMQAKPSWIFKFGTLMLVIYFIIAIPIGVLFGYVF